MSDSITVNTNVLVYEPLSFEQLELNSTDSPAEVKNAVARALDSKTTLFLVRLL